jgi:CheY-like chemotaxis protein
MGKAHALIIDDDPQNIEVLERLLTANDVSHTAVEDTNTLADTLREMGQLDVIFLDINMPRLNGYQVLASLRDSLGNHCPIVAYTVFSDEIANARSMGFDGFISKPLNPQRFARQLAEILSGKPVWDAS